MDDGSAREMTLDEWVDRLPPQHKARTELARLRDHCDALQARFEIVAEHHANCAVEREELREAVTNAAKAAARLCSEECPVNLSDDMGASLPNPEDCQYPCPCVARDVWDALKPYRAPQTDLSKCPKCGGPADEGHDREYPPNPYLCSRCQTGKGE